MKEYIESKYLVCSFLFVKTNHSYYHCIFDYVIVKIFKSKLIVVSILT